MRRTENALSLAGKGRHRTEAAVEIDNKVDHLERLADLGSKRLSARLAEIRADLDLDRRRLIAAQDDIVRLDGIGAMPGLTEYWQRWAVPKADEFLTASLGAVLDEGRRLAKALDELADAITDPTAGPTGQTMRRTSSDTHTEPGLALTLYGRRDAERTAAHAAARLRGAVPTPAPIHDVGLWWQRRLRRSAMRRAMPQLLGAEVDPDRLIGGLELSLLDNPPWCHGDRLLLAFELAHSEIRNRTDLVANALGGRLFQSRPPMTPLMAELTFDGDEPVSILGARHGAHDQNRPPPSAPPDTPPQPPTISLS